jgi:hypothetical protein
VPTFHHDAPRWLLGLFDAAAGDLADWSEFDAEAGRLSIEVRELSRQGLRALIKSSTHEIPTSEHRRLHREASDFVWWGRSGGHRPSSVGERQDAAHVQEDAVLPVTEVLEYRPHEDGYLQLEIRRYVRLDGSAWERGPYWHFQIHEGGKRKKSTLAAKRTKPSGE